MQTKIGFFVFNILCIVLTSDNVSLLPFPDSTSYYCVTVHSLLLWAVVQSEVVGVEQPPHHWPEEQANTLFLALLRPIFALKTKIAPPQRY